MTLRLGFIGVGRWGRKLADAFRACGAEIVAHDRRTMTVSGSHNGMPVITGLDGFGEYKPWRDQLADNYIDAIVAVAPPDVTTSVALACAETGKPVLAAKPLWKHPETIRAPFYVDFWRLWSKAQASAHQARGTLVSARLFNVSLAGSGPDRAFPGIFDYGPHVAAALLDLCPDATVTGARRVVSAESGRELYRFTTRIFGTTVESEIGNGATVSKRCIWGHEETATHIGDEPKDEILRNFCRSFLADVSEGFADTRLLNLSREGMRLLRQIRETAT